MRDTTTQKGPAALAAVPLFAIGDRVRFWHGRRRVSGIIYDVGPTQYCVTVWFGSNHINLGVDHTDATLANSVLSNQSANKETDGTEN